MDSDAFDIVEAKVTYTTKELLQRIDYRFERLEAVLSDLASTKQVDALETRVIALEQDAEGTKKVATALLNQKSDYLTKREKVFGAIFASITIGLNLFSLSAGPHIFG